MSNYVNTTMKMINDFTDEIYEGLMDEDYASVNEAIVKLQHTLRDVQQTIKQE
jgi:hypothetical protein